MKNNAEFLSPETVERHGALASLELDAIEYLKHVAAEISRDAEIKRLALSCHSVLCGNRAPSRDEIKRWEGFNARLGEHAGAFFLLIALSALPRARTFHRERGIPDHVMRATYTDTAIWALDYKTKHGVWGLALHILPWLFNHLFGELYRLERLQFMQRPFRQPFYAFRHEETHEVVLLADSGVSFRGDGQLDGTGGEHDPQNRWTSRLETTERYVAGTYIHPGGFAVKGDRQLPRDVWKQALAPGDPILEIHIPAGEPMDFDACGRSFRQALDFFPRYFPDRPFVAFGCASWLLNTQFQDWLSPESNMVRFQKEFYLFPIFSGGRSGIDRIFGGEVRDFANAPRDTSLRRAVLDHLQRGGYLRGGGGVLFPDELDWGRNVYLRG